MRPQSEVRISLAAALVDGPGTTRELACRVGCSIDLAKFTLRDMVKAGDARKTYTRVAGVCRPVPVYHRAVRATELARGDNGFKSLIAAWAGVPASCSMEAAM